MARRKRTRKFRFLIGIGFLILAGAAAYWLAEKGGFFRPAEKPNLGRDRDLIKRRNKDVLSRRGSSHLNSHRKMLAIVIDDIGHDQVILEELLRIDQPITFAILPFCRYSTQSAERAHRAGREVLLHLPMEPHGYPAVRPGEGALLSSMSLDELSRELFRDLKAVPHARGVNNHMGSRLMEDEKKLETVFRIFERKRLFFMDSLTTVRSKGREAALGAGVPFAQRDAFIDSTGQPEAAARELEESIRGEGNWQKKILIGHPYPGTLRALKKATRLLRTDKVEIVPVSRIAEMN